jgi:hypothetical protein
MRDVLQAVPNKVCADMNRQLDAPFDTKEVKTALFRMYPTKAPGPDGYTQYLTYKHSPIQPLRLGAALSFLSVIGISA